MDDQVIRLQGVDFLVDGGHRVFFLNQVILVADYIESLEVCLIIHSHAGQVLVESSYVAHVGLDRFRCDAIFDQVFLEQLDLLHVITSFQNTTKKCPTSNRGRRAVGLITF